MDSKTNRDWKRIIGIILLLLVGLSLILYPMVSSVLAELNQSRAIEKEVAAIEVLDRNYLSEELQKAMEYNDALAHGKEAPYPYEELLAVNDTMGYIEIPSIGLKVSIKHGIGEDVLQNYVGHMEGTSLPVGGTGTHCVLSGHSGLTTAKIFTNLPEVQVGDVFIIYVLDEAFVYKITELNTVLPDDNTLIEPVPGKDICTLITCVPYGVNSHRLLVRGERVFDVDWNNINPVTPEQAVVAAISKEMDMLKLGGIILFLMVIALILVRIVATIYDKITYR